MPAFSMTVEGEVGGKGRPRSRVIWSGGKALATIYPDPDSAKMEALIKGLVYAQRRAAALIVGPVEFTLEIFMPIPPSWSKAKKEAAFFYTGKPDADNAAKLLMDAFNKTVWEDDAQVSDLIVRRRYTHGSPYIRASVCELVREPVGDLLTPA